MTVLFHVVLKDHENSGFVWDDFYCPACLEERVAHAEHLEVLQKHLTTPKHLSRLFPPIVNEPVCAGCGLVFNHWSAG